MIDRVTQPDFKQVDKIKFSEPNLFELSNGVKVYTINAGSQDVLEIDFLFEAGTWFQDKKLIASFTNQMLTEGTSKLASSQIHEKLDYYGAFLGQNVDEHQAEITLFTLNRYLSETLTILEDLIKNPIFPEKELEVIRLSNKQGFLVNREKVSKKASNQFAKVIFGEKHPYGKRAELEDYDIVNTSHLKEFHKKYYTPDRMTIVAAGKITDDLIEQLENTFGNGKQQQTVDNDVSSFEFEVSPQKKHFIEKENAVQSAIRIGFRTINQSHPDFCGLMVLNTILGGYFGSRLMSNIREDKGYTYGISSHIVSQRETGYFIIASETGTEVCRAAIDEIYKEIKRLRTEKIEDSELQLVQNYLLGDVLRGFDGPFKLSEAFKNLLSSNLDYSFYENYIETIKTISAEKLMELANKYLQENDMYEVVAGKLIN